MAGKPKSSKLPTSFLIIKGKVANGKFYFFSMILIQLIRVDKDVSSWILPL